MLTNYSATVSHSLCTPTPTPTHAQGHETFTSETKTIYYLLPMAKTAAIALFSAASLISSPHVAMQQRLDVHAAEGITGK